MAMFDKKGKISTRNPEGTTGSIWQIFRVSGNLTHRNFALMSKAFLFVFQNKLLSKTGTQLHTSVRFRSICVSRVIKKDLKD